MQHPAPQSEADRGGSLRGGHARAAATPERGRHSGRRLGRLPGCRHDRVSARAKRGVLLPRDEHAAPGRAPGDRASVRCGHRARAATRRPGQPLRVHAGALQPRGHALECRITAEDPFNSFLPATGVIRYLVTPSGPGVRWDGGIEAGNEVTLFYDPLLGKLIVWGDTRATALRRMQRALRELVIVGIPSSQAFHLRVMADPDFQRGDFDITYLEHAGPRLLATGASPEVTAPLAVVAALLAEQQRAAEQSPPPTVRPPDRQSAWTLAARREALDRCAKS